MGKIKLSFNWLTEDRFLKPKKVLVANVLAILVLLWLTLGTSLEWANILANTLIWIWTALQVIFAGAVVAILAELGDPAHVRTMDLERASALVKAPVTVFYVLGLTYTVLLYMNHMYWQGGIFLGCFVITIFCTDLIRNMLNQHIKDRLRNS